MTDDWQDMEDAIRMKNTFGEAERLAEDFQRSREAEAERRPATRGSTAALDKAIRKAFKEVIDYQAEHGSSDTQSARLLGMLEGLQLAKTLV